MLIIRKLLSSRCANTVGISWEEVEKCVEGKEGHGLLAKFGDMTHNLQPRVSFIPTIQGRIYPSFAKCANEMNAYNAGFTQPSERIRLFAKFEG